MERSPPAPLGPPVALRVPEDDESQTPNENGRPEGRPFSLLWMSATDQAAAFSGANLP